MRSFRPRAPNRHSSATATQFGCSQLRGSCNSCLGVVANDPAQRRARSPWSRRSARSPRPGPLPISDDVGAHAFVRDGKRVAGTAHAAHDLVGAEQHLVPIADLPTNGLGEGAAAREVDRAAAQEVQDADAFVPALARHADEKRSQSRRPAKPPSSRRARESRAAPRCHRSSARSFDE
jgi:hypothetical protein